MRRGGLIRDVGRALSPFLVLWGLGLALFWSLGIAPRWRHLWPLASVLAHAYFVGLFCVLVPSAAAPTRHRTGAHRTAVYRVGAFAVAVAYVGAFLWVSQIIAASSVSYAHWGEPANLSVLLDFYANARFYLYEVAGANALVVAVATSALLLLTALGLYYRILAVKRLSARRAPQWVKIAGTAAPLLAGLVGVGLWRDVPDWRQREIWVGYQRRDPVGAFYVNLVDRRRLGRRVAQEETRQRPVLDALVEAARSEGAPAGGLPTVVVFTVDCLRRDYLGAYGSDLGCTPFLDSLAAAPSSVVVADAIANSNYSEGGILAIQQSHVLTTSLKWRPGLVDYLDAVGYESAFFLLGNHYAFGNMDLLYGSAVDHLVQGSGFVGQVPTDDRGLVSATEDYLARSPPTASRPLFLNYHLMSAHYAGKHFLAPGDEAIAHVPDLDDLDVRERKYLLGVRQSDLIIREICRRLARAGLLDEAIVVVTADHGESFGTGDRTDHGVGYYPEQFRIPLILAGAGVAGRRLRDRAAQTDIAPTVTDLLGYPSPSTWQGTSLLRAADPHYTPLRSREAPDYRVLVRASTGSAVLGVPRDAVGRASREPVRWHVDDLSASAAGGRPKPLEPSEVDVGTALAFLRD